MGKDRSWKLDTTLKIDDDQLKTPMHNRMCFQGSQRNTYCFKVLGPLDMLQDVKYKIRQVFSKLGHRVENEHAYFDRFKEVK